VPVWGRMEHMSELKWKRIKIVIVVDVDDISNMHKQLLGLFEVLREKLREIKGFREAGRIPPVTIHVFDMEYKGEKEVSTPTDLTLR